MSDDLISRRALYDKAATLEAQALDYVGKLIERDGEETSVEWRIWSAILTERTAFKHDVYDAPSAQPERRGKWQITDAYPHNVYCSECHTRFAQTHWAVWEDGSLPRNFCPNCGAKMQEENDERT